MVSDERLVWVQRNRTRRRRERVLSQILGEYVGRLSPDGGKAITEVASVANSIVDDEFRQQCRLAALKDRTLFVEVNQPGLVYSMRVRWNAELCKGLARLRGGSRVDRVVFQFGQPRTGRSRTGQPRTGQSRNGKSAGIEAQ